jgi:hypothetical protein
MTSHSYPPPITTPEQFDAYVAELLQTKMNAMSAAFTQEWDNREKGLRAENEELCAQLQSAADQITAIRLSFVNYISSLFILLIYKAGM